MNPGKLSQEEIFALGALLHAGEKIVSRVKFEYANWIGWCARGHLIVALVPITFLRCTEPVDPLFNDGVGLCRLAYAAMPHQEGLLSAYKLGGWEALVEAAQALIDGAEQAG